MANRREYDMLFKLNAQMGSAYSSTFTKAQQQLVSMQKELDALSKRQSDITAYQRQQGAIEATQKKLEVLQQQHDNIQREISETGTYSSDLANKLLAKEQQIHKTSDALAAQTQKLDTMAGALRDAGVDTGNLAAASAQLAGQMDDLKFQQENVAAEAANMEFTTTQAFDAIQQAIVAAGIAKALEEIAGFLLACTDAAIEYERVMAGVRRTVGGTDEQMAALSDEFKSMVLNIPITTSELGGIAEAAGQLGVARDDIAEFSEVMSKLSTTTDLTADNAATMLAQFANITGFDGEYERLGSAIAELEDAAATTSSKTVDMAQGIAAAASIAGMSETDILGIAASVGSLGIEAQAGGTSISKLISELYRATETGEGLREFAAVANMTADEFAWAWGDNAVSAMDAFIQGLNDTERNGRSAMVVLDELGITETRQVRAVLGLAQAGDLLSRSVEQSNRAFEQNTALQAKADIMYNTTAAKLQLMENAYNNLQIAIGDQFTPELQGLYELNAQLMTVVADFVEKNPGVVKALTAFLGVMGAVTLGLAGYTAAAKLAAIATTALSAAIPGVNVILGVTAAVAGFVAVMTLLASSEDEASKEFRALTEVSKEQYTQLQDLEREYQALADAGQGSTAEAAALKEEIALLNWEFENGKRTLEQFNAENEALRQAMEQSGLAYQGAVDGINDEAESSNALIGKLEELSAKTSLTAGEQAMQTAIVDELNSRYADLGLSIDDTTGKLNLNTDAIRDQVRAQADALKQQKNMARAVELLQQMDEKEKLIEEAAANAAVAQQKVNKAQADFDAAAKANGTNPAANARLYATQMQGVATALREAEAELKPYVDEQARLQAEYDISAAEASRLEKEMVGLAETQAEAAAQLRFAGMEEMGLKIEDVTKRLDTLADAYEQVRDAAVSSVEDQFELWDKAAGLTGKDAIGLDKLITGAQTQAQYWENYESNLQALLASESEFAGLGEVVAELSTKGLEGASAISALADALEDPKKIQKYIDKWNTLQGLEKTTADTLTKMRVDLTTEMDGVQQDLESFVASMSLGDEAKQSGIETLRGLIEGLGDKGLMYEVETAYRNVLNAGIAQLGGRPVISQEEMDLMRKYSNAAIYYTVDGSHAGGLENVPYDGYIAELHKGERVLTAEENRMLSNPQVVAASQYFVDARLMDALSAYAVDVSVPELEMKLPSSSVSGINLTLNVSFNIDADVASNTPALMGTLEQASAKMSEDLREAFADLMDDYQRDQARRVW